MSGVPDHPLISVIIPSYNEGNDIRLSIEAALQQRYPRKEIIIVDDSHDETPRIIDEYKRFGISVYRQERNKGCCSARNLGIRMAKGDIVVLLNADVHPAPDFMDRILGHYRRGADYVLCQDKVSNPKHLFPRFWDAFYSYHYYFNEAFDPEWTEGFSCRREAAVSVGGIPGDFPLRFCRDWLLGKTLNETGHKKILDRTIVVSHKAPETLAEFWRVRVTRGRFSALFKFYIDRLSLVRLVARLCIKQPYYLLKLFTLIIPLTECMKIVKHSSRKHRDLLPFLYCYYLLYAAFMVGEWKGVRDLYLYHKAASEGANP